MLKLEHSKDEFKIYYKDQLFLHHSFNNPCIKIGIGKAKYKLKGHRFKIKDYVEEPKIFGDESGDVLVVSWGSTYGTVLTVVEQLRKEGKKVSFYHLRWINPLPNSLRKYIKNFKKVIVPEVNLGQLAKIIRSEYLVDANSFNKVRGLPLQIIDLKNAINKLIEDK